MSFTTDVHEELIGLPLKKTCCRKALLFGILCACRPGETGDEWIIYLYHGDVAELAVQHLRKGFHAQVSLTRRMRAGRDTFCLSVHSAALSQFLDHMDDSEACGAEEAVGFRCAACEQEFLRGVFLGCGTVSDPRRGYHLELILPTAGRAAKIAAFLETRLTVPGRVRRGERFGLYYKSNGAVSDFLYFAGCSKTSFEVANACIERDIRNNENRATNCVARNISRSVGAAKKQREAVERLIRSGRLEGLSEELRYTARLRIENESATLTELALLHQPPISKSGLNRRLTKLIEAAEECDP
ncbi:MAG: DNA-binding protein WhiA [Clostridia bacterium]|nr:DNA-binding protein WhiA [Clostridia bacterium]